MTKPELKERFLSDVAENQKVILKVCYIYTSTKDDFNDLFQEIHLQLWKSYNTFKGQSKLSTWIYRIALNTALQRLRKTYFYNPIDLSSNQYYDLPEIPSESISSNLAHLHDLINQLNDLEKAIIILYLDKYSHKEIADIVGISKTNVGTKISRIKQKLKSISKR